MVVAIMVCFSQSVLASPPSGTRSGETLREAWALPETPENRMELWTRSLQRFLDGHPNLSPSQREVLQRALDTTRLDLFPDNPDARQKIQIASTLLGIKKSLYCTKYAELFTDFEGLATWLREQNVVAADEATPCNCGAGGCADGYTCSSSGCYAEPGTTNYGRCYPKSGGGGLEELMQ